MVKDEEDWHGLQITKLKSLAKLFKPFNCNGVNNKECLYFFGSQWSWYVHVPRFHVLMDWDVLPAFTAKVFTVSFVLHGSTTSSPSPYYLPLFTVTSVWWVPVFPFCMRTHDLVSRICQLWEWSYLGPGCQYCNLLDISCTQPPFSNAVNDGKSIFLSKVVSDKL